MELAGEDHILERRELRFAQVDALLELPQLGGEVRDLGAHALAVALRSATGRIAVEIEFAAVDVRHLGEALAERIEADHVRVDLAEPHGHGVDPQLHLLLEIGYLLFLLGEQRAKTRGIGEHHPLVVVAAELHPERKGAAEEGEHEGTEGS